VATSVQKEKQVNGTEFAAPYVINFGWECDDVIVVKQSYKQGMVSFAVTIFPKKNLN